MTWIEAARNAPVTGASTVPVPERRPRPPARKAAAPQPSKKPVESAASDPVTTGSISRPGAAGTPAPPPVRRPPAPERAAAPARKMPPLRTAQKKKRPAGSSQEARKCEALGRCRDAFAKCKAKFVKEHGKWDLEKQTCGADYKVCIRKTFAPGEMFFTRWFWPYEECP